MADIQLDCPHPDCLTEKAGFFGNQFYQFKPQSLIFILLLRCRVCGNGVIAKYLCHEGNFQQWVSGQNPDEGVHLIETWPKRSPLEAPEHTPDNIRHYYLQGMDNINRKNFDAAGTMFRKSLDSALRRLHSSGKGALQQRIDSLPDEIGITPAMRQWAHEIRILGNDAAHEEEPFKESETRPLQAFTELFLTYAFTLPGMLMERRGAPPPESSE
jgi:hypothetical protein